jgi:hypothetical protein
MDVALYTGNGSTQTISGLEFSPDLIWVKSRSAAYSTTVYDTVRGAYKSLATAVTNAEGTNTSGLSAFNSDGFNLDGENNVLGSTNVNAVTYVAWTWDAGSSTVTLNPGDPGAGSITSSVRANPSAGFSIVTYTGTGSNATVGHGLGVAPKLIICKTRTSAVNWIVYHGSLGTYDFLRLNTTDTKDNNSTVWNTAPTSTVFGIGSANGVNQSSDNYVAYCFAPVSGYSAMGSYVGNGSSDGPFVYTGFRPRWVMIKRTDASGYGWYMVDAARKTYNVMGPILEAQSSTSEYSASFIDFTSNGFKLRLAGNDINPSGGTILYVAFAESPFQYARAR